MSKIQNCRKKNSLYTHEKALDEGNRPVIFTVLYNQYFDKYRPKEKQNDRISRLAYGGYLHK